MVLHIRMNLSSSRKEDEINDLVSDLQAISNIDIKHLILSKAAYMGKIIGIVEISTDETTLDGVAVAFYGSGVKAIGIISSWINRYNPEEYTFSVQTESTVDSIIETIKDKTKNVGIKSILLQTGAKTVIGNFDINDIPHDADTLELL